MPENISAETGTSDTTTLKKPIWWLIAILVLLSILGISSRLLLSGAETLAGGDRLWRLAVNVSTVASAGNTSINIHPPFDTPHIRSIQRNLTYPNYKVRKPAANKKPRRSIHVTAINNGASNVSAEYFLHLSQTPFILAANNTELTTAKRESFLLDDTTLQFKSYTVKEVVKKLLQKQPNQELIVDEIYSFLKSFPIYLGKDAANVPRILTQKKATIYDRSLAMVALSRAVGIPARLVSGIILKDEIEPQPHYWVEVYQENLWSAYDVHFGYKQTVPINYLPMRRNAKDIVEIVNGDFNQIEYDLEQEFNHPSMRQKEKEQWSSIFDLTRLSLDIRNELAILLLLPLGALITALFRHLVGVHSYGVFTPTLLALAIVYANFITTLTVFIVVISLAIGGRSFFPTTLTRIPRLSIIFTLIAVILTLSVSVLNYFDIEQEGKIILLPIIILTSLVDRFYNTIEDMGLKIALRRMVWTIIIALLCLPVIQFETLGHLILEYPEIHFSTLAIFLTISLYKGKHLINLPVLKILAEPKVIKKKKNK